MKKQNLLLIFLTLIGFLFFVGFVWAACASNGVCDSTSTGICLDDGTGNLVSSDCSLGCSENICHETDYDILYDSFGRIGAINDLNDSTKNIMYDYYGNTNDLFKVTVGGGDEVYMYDVNGSILSEEYSSHPEDDKYYLYYSNGYLQTVFNFASIVDFTYYNMPGTEIDGKLKTETTTLEGVVLTTLYSYTSEGYVSKITTLDKIESFTYDTDGKVIRETVERQVDGGIYKTIEGVNYTHDAGGNILSLKDDTGVVFDYNYSEVTYPCKEAVCTSMGCTDASECYTLYSCSSGTCVPYNCSNITYVNAVCNYSQLNSKTNNNYAVNIINQDTETTMGNTWGVSYTPNLQYDANGTLIKQDEINYNYDSNYTMNKISVDNPIFGEYNMTLDYDNQDMLNSTEETSDFGGLNIEYTYNVLGVIVEEEYTDDSGSTGSLTGNAIVNLFKEITGHAISSSSSRKVYYTSPGSSDSAKVTPQQYANLVSSSVIWPELAPYYAGVVDNNGNIIKPVYLCVDSDENMLANSTFNFGNARQGTNIIYDDCGDDNTLMEAYCGVDFKLDFWNTAKVAKYKTISCEFGCNAGTCLTQPLAGNITIPPNNMTNVTIPEINRSLGLPSIPKKPGE